MGRGFAIALLLAAALASAASPARGQDGKAPSAAEVAAWTRDLGAADAKISFEAWRNLSRAGPTAVPALIGVLREGNELAATRTCILLKVMGDAATPALPAVEALLADPSREPATASAAALALWTHGVRPEKAVARLRFLGRTDAGSGGLLWRVTGEEEGLRDLLRRDLARDNSPARAFALEVLEEFGTGERMEFAVGLALAAAEDRDAEVRSRALRVLGSIAPGEGRSYAPLLAGLSDESPMVRWAAARGLGRRGAEAPGTAAALARSCAKWESGSVIAGLVDAAGSPEAAKAPLLRVLAGGDPADRTGAALLLYGPKPYAPGTAEALAAGIYDPDPVLRNLCLRRLRAMDEEAGPAAPVLARALGGSNRTVAAAAASVLRELAGRAESGVPDLVGLLSAEDGWVRETAFGLLSALGPRPATAIRAALTEEEILRRPEVALLLVSADPDLPGRDPRFLSVLTASLGSPSEPVRAEGIRLLRACGPRAAGAVPALAALLGSASYGNRADAGRILVDLGAAAVPGLIPLLASPDPETVMAACRTLGAIRRPAAPAAQALLGATTSKVPWVRRAAAEALIQVAPDDPATPTAMILLLNDEAPDNRACAARSLGMLRRDSAADALAAAAESDRWARMEYCLALGKLGKAGLPHLERLAAHDDPDVRMWAIRGISSMGPAAKETVPLLRKALVDSASPVREAADRALKGLDPGAGGPQDPELLLGRKVREILDRAGILARQDKPAEALALYEEATRVDPGCVAAWMEVGLVHHNAKRYPEALEAYATALRIEPDHGPALYNSGLCMSSLRRYEEAVRFHREAARARPGHAATLVSMGYALYFLGRYEDSLAASREGLRLDPKDTNALQRIGLSLLKLDRTAEAVEPLRELVRLAPRFEPGHAYLAAALRRSGDPAAAEPVARKAIEIDAKDPLPRATLFKSLRTLGRKEEAARELEALRALSPEEAERAEKGN